MAGKRSLGDQLPPQCHFIRDGRLLRAGQCSLRCREYDVVFDSNMFAVDEGEITHGLTESICLASWKMAVLETLQTEPVNFCMQCVGPPMVVFERLQC